MKRLKNWLLPLFTLLLVAVGAAMPYAVAYMQDTRQTDPEIRPFDSFSLTLQQKSDLGHIFRTITTGAYYMNEAAKAENAVLTEGLALEAAENILIELVNYEIIEKELVSEFLDPSVTAQTIIPVPVEDESRGIAYDDTPIPLPDGSANASASDAAGLLDPDSAIPTWNIYWTNPCYAYIWLDDASSKMLQFQINDYQPTGMDVYSMAEKWLRFLNDHYGVTANFSDEEWYSDAADYTLSFPLDDDEEPFYLHLYLNEDGYMSLSPYG